MQEKQTEQVQKQAVDKPKEERVPTVGRVKLTTEQIKILKDGGYIYLEKMQKKDDSKASAYLFFDDKMSKPFFTQNNPEWFVKYGKYEMRLMDKIRIEAGFMTKPKVKWYGGYAYPYLWKENKSKQGYVDYITLSSSLLFSAKNFTKF